MRSRVETRRNVRTSGVSSKIRATFSWPAQNFGLADRRGRGGRDRADFEASDRSCEVVGDQAVKEQNAKGDGEGDRPRDVGLDEHIEVEDARPSPRHRPADAGPSSAAAEPPDHAVRRGHGQRNHEKQGRSCPPSSRAASRFRRAVSADVRRAVEAEEEQEVEAGMKEGKQPEHPPELAEPAPTGDPARGRDGE